MTTNEKIAALRAAAKAAGADGVLIMTSDPHCSEYLPGYYNALPWFSGFIGENSTLVVTQDCSALWCDGRFYVQADRQLAGSEIECMHAGSAGVPTVAEYLESHFAQGETLPLDDRDDAELAVAMESHLESRELMAQIMALPPPDGELFLRLYLYGETAAQLGARFAMPAATVRTRLHRARLALQKLLKEG